MTERNMQQVIEGWRNEVPPACTCPPSDETMDSHFHKADCPEYAWKRKNFQCCTVTQRKCADEASVLRERLVELVQRWHSKAADYDATQSAKLTLTRCADALEAIIGPVEGE